MQGSSYGGGRDVRELYRMINSNSKYLTVPHGVPEHLKRNNSSQSNPLGFDKNKIYAQRSDNPIVLPK
jgi:hypothetical protein